MGIVDNVLKATVPYSADDAYAAMQKAADKLHGHGFYTDMLDDELRIVYLNTTFSTFSPGEKIIAALGEAEGGASVYIESVPKSGVALSRAMDMGKNKKKLPGYYGSFQRGIKKLSGYRIAFIDRLHLFFIVKPNHSDAKDAVGENSRSKGQSAHRNAENLTFYKSGIQQQRDETQKQQKRKRQQHQKPAERLLPSKNSVFHVACVNEFRKY